MEILFPKRKKVLKELRCVNYAWIFFFVWIIKLERNTSDYFFLFVNESGIANDKLGNGKIYNWNLLLTSIFFTSLTFYHKNCKLFLSHAILFHSNFSKKNLNFSMALFSIFHHRLFPFKFSGRMTAEWPESKLMVSIAMCVLVCKKSKEKKWKIMRNFRERWLK